jgi:hypothetical protein
VLIVTAILCLRKKKGAAQPETIYEQFDIDGESSLSGLQDQGGERPT